jgi:hypothetical protein
MRIASLLSFGLGLSLVACAAGAGMPEDELAGESSADGDDSKNDLNGTYTYFDLTKDTRQCLVAGPGCGGFYVDRVNRSQTACTGGASGPIWAPSCYVADIDWSDTGLSQAQIDRVMGEILSGASGRVLVRGNLRSHDFGGGTKFGRLLVEEAWVAQTPGDYPDGVFVKVRDAGVRCFAAPCESNAELKLNSSLYANIADIDFGPSGASEVTIGASADALFAGGVIIAGYRDYVYADGRSARSREANQVYLRLVAGADAPCYVGGCSGQVCSDHEGVITTCQWQPEYACYADATCERQVDGACGWTQTDELDACLANPPE